MKKRFCPTSRSRAFSVIELLAVIAIITVLAAILIPLLSKFRTQARLTQSLSNLHQIHSAVGLYSNDHNNRLPHQLGGPSVRVYLLQDTIDEYLPFKDKAWICPIVENDGRTFPQNPDLRGRYYFNWYLAKSDPNRAISLYSVQQPSEAMLAANLNIAAVGGFGDGYSNVLFVDGSVQRIKDDSSTDYNAEQSVRKIYLPKGGKAKGYDF